MRFVISVYQWGSSRIRILECCKNVVLKSAHLEIQISKQRGEAKKYMLSTYGKLSPGEIK